MKHVRVSLEDVERATKRLDAIKTHLETWDQRIRDNNEDHSRLDKERRIMLTNFKAREKDLKTLKENLHRQIEPKPDSESRRGHNWTDFEDDNLRQSLVDFLELKAIQYGRTSWAIQLRIRDKITSPGCPYHQETVCGDRHYKV